MELRAEDDRFLRLLEILGAWYEKGKLLIFVSSQEKCDDLFRNLLRVRICPMPCAVLPTFPNQGSGIQHTRISEPRIL